MFAQALAFLTRSIRQESRLLTHHAMRGAMVLSALVAFFWQVTLSPKLSASGLMLVSKISSYCYYSLTLLGIMYFSLAITEEKEEETLPLLRMTGVRNFTLLFGKSMPRLAIVVLLILVASPFLLLAISLGGVIPEQIFALVLGMICYAVCLSQLGLFCSTISRNSQRAVGLTFVLWLVLEFGGWLLNLLAIGCKEWGMPLAQEWLDYFGNQWWDSSMWSASNAYLSFVRGDRILHLQMAFHLCAGLAFFLLSWLLFEQMNQASLA
ncbi:MAG: ABC transporter permease, partial [Planctomycetota bacterium]|nr:ABC transporter permease [Planctomycetota bacterium]